MQKQILQFFIRQIANFLIGSDIFERVKARVFAWEDKQLSGLEKRFGVTKEIRAIGIEISEQLLNFAIELALVHIRQIR